MVIVRSQVIDLIIRRFRFDIARTSFQFYTGVHLWIIK